MSISEADRGNKCPHGDVIGSCPSSQCYIWTLEEVFEHMPEHVDTIRKLEAAATEAMGQEVIYDFPCDQHEADPHPCVTSTSMTFRTRDNAENTCGKLHEIFHAMEGCNVTGGFITHVIVEKVQ